MRFHKTFTLTIICLSALMTIGQYAAAQASARQLVIVEKTTHMLDIVDPVSLKVLAKVPIGQGPHEAITSDDGKLAFTSHPGGAADPIHTISVVDLVAQKPLPPIDISPFAGAHGLDFENGKLYFTAGLNNSIGRYDPATQKVDWAMGIPSSPSMVAVSKDGSEIVTCAGGAIVMIEKAPASAAGQGHGELWKVSSVPMTSGGEGVALAPDGKTAWGINGKEGTVSVVDLVGKTVTKTIPITVTRPDQLEVAADGKHVVVAGLGPPAVKPTPGGGSVDRDDPNSISFVVIDVDAGKQVKEFKLGGGAERILMDPNSNRAFVSVTGAEKVFIVDLNTVTIAGEIDNLADPDGMAWVVR